MLDPRQIRQDPEGVAAALARRGTDARASSVPRVVQLDAERRALIAEGDELKARRNAVSLEGGERKRRKGGAEAVSAEMRGVGDRRREIDGRLREVEEEVEHALLRPPNLPDPSLPDG